MALGDGTPALPTLFAPAERTEGVALEAQVYAVAHHPIVVSMLQAVGGMVAVLNRQRQVLAANLELLRGLSLSAPEDLLGLRPGEALGCVHAYETEGGCGTGSYCASCGAALSILAAQDTGQPDERDCVLTLGAHEAPEDRVYRARSAPLRLGGQDLVLLFLRDTTEEHWRACLERVFLHDVGNAVSGVVGAADLLEPGPGCDDRLVAQVKRGTRRVKRELEAQRSLRKGAPLPVRATAETCPDLVDSLREAFSHHATAHGRRLTVAAPLPQRPLTTDAVLLERVLGNMLINAFEASPEGGEVVLRAEEADGGVRFSVWNAGQIAPAARKRIFQRHFSTKAGTGRGLGTYSMKLFGEKHLGGRVEWESGETGTTFSLWVPWGG